MSHPSLGREPRDLTAGFPDAADRLRTSRGRIAARSLDIALAAREGMRERYDELGLRQLLRDAELLVDRWSCPSRPTTPITCASTRCGRTPSTAAGAFPWTTSSRSARASARRRRACCRRRSRRADAALDEAIEVYRWNRRLAGDARKRNAILQFLYKGG